MTITINLKGRLGNQLFQYATLRNLSLKKNFGFYIDRNKEWHGQSNLLNSFNIPENSELKEIKYNYFQPNGSNFYDININNINDDTLLDGHFENIQYFEENKEIIQKELSIKDNKIIEFTNEYINNINKDNSKIIGIHFRRGDLVQQIHLHDEYGNSIDNFNEKTKNYVYQCLETILQTEKKIIVILFTGGIRKQCASSEWIEYSHNDDLQWITNFALENKSKINMYISPGTKDNNELLDFNLLSICDYIIIPHLSTFSFMASYVNTKIIKLFTPKKIYG